MTPGNFEGEQPEPLHCAMKFFEQETCGMR